MPNGHAEPLIRHFKRHSHTLSMRSRAITLFLERRMSLLAAAWIIGTLGFALMHMAFPASPIAGWYDALPVLIAYTSVIAAPLAGFLIADAAFDAPAARAQPTTRLAVFGRWRPLSAAEARAMPCFGPVGFMASLLVGMLLNVAVRTLEFFAAVPAMSYHAPAWGQAMFALMSLDAVVTGFFYMAAFAMALRTVPLFPRMLAYAWVIDIAMQLIIARQLAMVGHLPASVVAPLLALLKGNIAKVCISAAVWLPYLLLSQRVNVTYRSRTAAEPPLKPARS